MQKKLMKTSISLMISAIFTAGMVGNIHAQANDAKAVPKKIANNKKAVGKLGSGIELQWIDKNVRPQDDFFRFTAGKWLDTAEIPADKGRTGSFDALADLSLNQ